ncbi:MAG: hypothetical protein ACMXYA_03620 [Candidatus Woesearchaeota archaeon]
MKYEGKSVMFGRRPRKNDNEFKTAFFLIYDVENPIEGEHFPVHELEFEDIEYVQIPQNTSLKYYLEGNDLVISPIQGISLEQKDKVIHFQIH